MTYYTVCTSGCELVEDVAPKSCEIPPFELDPFGLPLFEVLVWLFALVAEATDDVFYD